MRLRKHQILDFFASYYREMAEQGVFLPPSQFEGLFLSTVHSDEDIEKTLQAIEHSFSKLKSNFMLIIKKGQL